MLRDNIGYRSLTTWCTWDKESK